MHQLDLFGAKHLQPEELGTKIRPQAAPQTKEKPEVMPEMKLEAKQETEQETKQVPRSEVPTGEEEPKADKMYYPISEVAAMFNVNISLLRYWEKEFDILQPRKNKKGDRLFRPEDIKNLKLIHFLLREKKYTIEGAKSFIKKGKKVNEKFEAIETLKKIRSMLMEFRSGL